MHAALNFAGYQLFQNLLAPLYPSTAKSRAPLSLPAGIAPESESLKLCFLAIPLS
jgi:hypothetical protein